MEWSINMIFYSKEFFSSGLMLMLLRKIPSFQPSCDVVRQLSSTELNKMLLSRFVYNAISSSLVWTITVQFIPLDLDWSLFTIFFHFNNDSNWSFGLFWRHLSAQLFWTGALKVVLPFALCGRFSPLTFISRLIEWIKWLLCNTGDSKVEK